MRFARTAYWSRHCMRHAPPSDQVVFEQDAGEIGRLMSLQAGYHRSRPGEEDPPHAWLPPASYAFIPQAGWAPRVGFMHGRRAPGAGSRLVVIELHAMRHGKISADRHTVFFYPRVFSGSLLAPGTEVRRYETTARISLGNDERLRLYAGQAHPTDAARFTIDCAINGERGTIEGRLGAEDAVTLRPLTGEKLKAAWRVVGARGWWDED